MKIYLWLKINRIKQQKEISKYDFTFYMPVTCKCIHIFHVTFDKIYIIIIIINLFLFKF